MKFTTANTKNSEFSENFVVYIGTQTGSFKRIDVFNEDNPYIQTNLQNLKEISKESRITCINWADESQNEILVGRADKVIRTFDCRNNVFSETDLEVPGEGKSIVGVTWNDESIIAATDDGKVHILLNETPSCIETGDHLSKMRNCKENKKIIAVGGKERKNNFKIFDLETKKSIFSTKNVPHDKLQLEVPVWDSDFSFVNNSEFCVSTCSRYGYIRYYDTRQQRRPILNYTDKKDLAFSCMAEKNGIVYVGTTIGSMFAFDLKSLKYPLHTYKGFTGSLTDIDVDASGKFISTSSLDRYVRIHDAEKTHLLYQCYVKSKASQILLKPADDSLQGLYKKPEKSQVDQEYEELFEKMDTVNDTPETTKKRKFLEKPKASGKRTSGHKIKKLN